MLLGFLETLLSEASLRRVQMEKYVHNCLFKATNSTRDRLLRLVNYLPSVTVRDLVRCVFDQETLHTLAPKLSAKSRKLVTKAVVVYLELCVLEYKVERLIWIARRSGDLSEPS
ncbi:hypothetical protein PsorP6_003618 [Peronosclerospora sorghi]|uniref:Uncharacterized protein n=1 Tax=Peronosclerospora sorghi TaxID=230839 RepID=A0ACC0VQJ7_9STRA|nr:hypothetical protein PsorP6_003618 [Peronosclerospora sorghi]